MTKAFVRLGFISLGCIVWLIFAVFLLRFLGQSQNYGEFRHPLIQSEKPYVFLELTADRLANNAEQVTQELSETEQLVIPKLDIYPSKNGQWLVLNKAQFPLGETQLKRIRLLSREEIQKAQNNPDYPILSLEEVFQRYDFSSLALEVHSQHDSPFQKILQLVNKQNLGQRVVIISRYEGMTREIRKLEPQWLYSSSEAAQVKMDLMASLFLESLGSFNFEFIFLSDQTLQAMPLRLVEELDKRRKKIVRFTSSDTPFDEESFKEKLSYVTGTLEKSPRRSSL